MRKQALSFLCFISCAFLSLASLASSAKQQLTLDVYASCSEQVTVKAGNNLQIHIASLSSRSGSSLSGYMHFVNEAERYELNHYRYSFPKQSDLSLLFPGPEVSAKYYCQESPATRDLIIHVPNHGNVRMAVNSSANFASSPSPKGGHHLKIASSGTYHNMYAAGANTNNPYWLQFILATHKDNNAQLEVQYEFH